MVDVYAQRIVDFLMQFFGDSGPFLLLQAMQSIHLEPPVDDLTRNERKLLADTITDTILTQVCSARRAAIYRSQLYFYMEVYRNAAMHTYGESGKWG